MGRGAQGRDSRGKWTLREYFLNLKVFSGNKKIFKIQKAGIA
jgi:hypothetical protein